MSSTSPASQVEATEELRALFTAFPSDKGPVNGYAATYLIAVEGYSQPAIRKAVTRLIRGEFDWFDGRFLPTPAQVSRACRFCEDLITPPKRLSLPAPGDAVPTEEEWDRRTKQAEAARDRFGIKRTQGETVTDRDAIPEARKAELDRAVKAQADRIAAEGLPKLSEEALAIFRESAERAAPTPAEQFDEWDRRPTPTIHRNEEKAA
ncbi:MAG: hypothetical protein Q7T60_17010 [Sphingopyxis sp.]|nr:hypothetical protein [Sphingopyxis sp.]